MNGDKAMESEEKMKAEEIREAREYAESIVNAVPLSLIVLDENLKVVSASHYFYQAFKVKPEETEGKYIYDLGNRQWDIPKLRELLENILPRATSFDNFEVEHDFPSIGKCTMLLNARQIPRSPGKSYIILLAIEDITESKKILDELQAKIRQLEGVQREAMSSRHKIVELRRVVGELERRLLRKQG
jgi:PAS domain S-box-containing protein